MVPASLERGVMSRRPLRDRSRGVRRLLPLVRGPCTHDLPVPVCDPKFPSGSPTSHPEPLFSSRTTLHWGSIMCRGVSRYRPRAEGLETQNAVERPLVRDR